MPNQTPSLHLLAKAPIMGHCKSRLALEVGEERATEFQLACLRDVCAFLNHTVENFSLHLCVPREHDADLQFLPDDHGNVAVHVSSEPDLGEVLQETWESGHSENGLIFIGTDSPIALIRHLLSAIGQVQHGKVVLGPTVDGGVYLIGVPVAWKNPFRNVSWGSSSVHEQLVQNAAVIGSVSLPTEMDMDTLNDVRHLAPDFATLDFRHLETARLIDAWKRQQLV